METDTTSYNIPMAVTLEGELEKERLEDIFKQLIKRHESLRTSFEIHHEEPVQKIHKDVVFELESHVAWSMEHGAWDRDSLHAPCYAPCPMQVSSVPLTFPGLLSSGWA
jgi:surfactin family lipopeptide synthetase B/lichenysin synthetase B